MALLSTTDDTSGLTPDGYGALVVQPVQRDSVAYQVSTLIATTSHTINFPTVVHDPSTGWVAEGEEITPSDPGVDEVSVTPPKVAGLVKVSRELADDSTPAAQSVVGEGLARDLTAKVDAAFFANTTPNGPAGLLSVAGTSTVDSGGAFTNFDSFAAAIGAAEDAGAQVGAFVMKPSTALALAQLKQDSTSNLPLLGTAATNALDRRILGVPVLVSPAVDAATDAWAIPKSAVMLVQRGGAELEIDRSVYFTSYSVAVRAVMRVGFGFVHPAALVRIHDKG